MPFATACAISDVICEKTVDKMERFPPWGYTIVSLELPGTAVDALLAEARKASYKAIFREVGGVEDDAFRGQARYNRLTQQMGVLDTHIRAVAKALNPLHVPKAYSYLISRAGGEEQEPHQDFSDSDCTAVRTSYPGSVHASVIVALEKDTRVKVFAGCFATANEEYPRFIEIPVGYTHIFRGDLVHCGAAYSLTNYRLHVYLTFPRSCGTMTSTKPVFLCQYCGKMDPSSTSIRNHRFYCDENPDGQSHKDNRRKKQNERGE